MIFTGVYLLNRSRGDPEGQKLTNGHISDGVPTDGITGLQTRRSMQLRRSTDAGRASTGSAGFGSRGERGVLMHSFEENNVGLGLEDLAEDSDEDRGLMRTSVNSMDGRYNGTHRLKSDDG